MRRARADDRGPAGARAGSRRGAQGRGAGPVPARGRALQAARAARGPRRLRAGVRDVSAVRDPLQPRPDVPRARRHAVRDAHLRALPGRRAGRDRGDAARRHRSRDREARRPRRQGARDDRAPGRGGDPRRRAPGGADADLRLRGPRCAPRARDARGSRASARGDRGRRGRDARRRAPPRAASFPIRVGSLAAPAHGPAARQRARLVERGRSPAPRRATRAAQRRSHRVDRGRRDERSRGRRRRHRSPGAGRAQRSPLPEDGARRLAERAGRRGRAPSRLRAGERRAAREHAARRWRHALPRAPRRRRRPRERVRGPRLRRGPGDLLNLPGWGASLEACDRGSRSR